MVWVAEIKNIIIRIFISVDRGVNMVAARLLRTTGRGC